MINQFLETKPIITCVFNLFFFKGGVLLLGQPTSERIKSGVTGAELYKSISGRFGLSPLKNSLAKYLYYFYYITFDH